jgi:RNA polymerase sigma-70 factor (ECF subfamily)
VALITSMGANEELVVPRSREEPVPLERALVARAQGGDGAAFRVLFDRHAAGVRRFLIDLLGDVAAADEATQETFVRAHGRLGTLRDGDKLRPWLLGIARHVYYEERRARWRWLPQSTDEDEPEGPAPDASQVDRPVPSPEDLVLGREADRKLAEALERMSSERRAALVLRVDHGLDYDEIRRVMGWSLAKVKNEIHRARLELRARLGEYVQSGGNA